MKLVHLTRPDRMLESVTKRVISQERNINIHINC